MSEYKTERNRRIYERYMAGHRGTGPRVYFRELAAEHGISTNRARQIVVKELELRGERPGRTAEEGAE